MNELLHLVTAPVTENITLPIDIIDEDDWRLKV
jgi:hypothetical protein